VDNIKYSVVYLLVSVKEFFCLRHRAQTDSGAPIILLPNDFWGLE